MSKKEQIENAVWELIQPVLKEQGLTGVDAEYIKEAGEYELRVYIAKDDGIGIDECETFSKAIDPLLDDADIISDPYTLIVSSPGLGRVLKRPRDFEYAIGKEVELGTFEAVNGKKSFRGILKSADQKNITVAIDGSDVIFEKPKITKISLAFDF